MDENTLDNQDQEMSPDSAPVPVDHHKARGSMPEKAPEPQKEEKEDEGSQGVPQTDESETPPDEDKSSVDEAGEEDKGEGESGEDEDPSEDEDPKDEEPA